MIKPTKSEKAPEDTTDVIEYNIANSIQYSDMDFQGFVPSVTPTKEKNKSQKRPKRKIKIRPHHGKTCDDCVSNYWRVAKY